MVDQPDAVASAQLDPTNVSREEREARHGHKAAVVWFTGLPGSGKSTLARAVERRLFDDGHRTVVLDADILRQGVCSDLGFSASDRSENIRRAAEIARLGFDNGHIVLCAFISPYARDRARARALFPGDRFIEVFVECGVKECARRDPKGLYARAAAGTLSGMTGVTDPYEPPVAPDLILPTDREPLEPLATQLLNQLRRMRVLLPDKD